VLKCPLPAQHFAVPFLLRCAVQPLPCDVPVVDGRHLLKPQPPRPHPVLAGNTGSRDFPHSVYTCPLHCLLLQAEAQAASGRAMSWLSDLVAMQGGAFLNDLVVMLRDSCQHFARTPLGTDTAVLAFLKSAFSCTALCSFCCLLAGQLHWEVSYVFFLSASLSVYTSHSGCNSR